MAKKEIQETPDNRGFASCASRTVHHCVIAGNEGLLNKKYTDPKQGSAKDCSVIAALSSIVAVNAGRMKGSNLTYTFLTKTVTLNSKKLYVDSPNGNYVYASSNGGSWPMLWEKAFAQLISTTTCTPPTGCPEKDTCKGLKEPDIAKAFENGYAGLAALKEIGRYQKDVTGSIPYDAKTGLLTWPAIATTNSTLAEDNFWKRDHDYSIIKYNITTNKFLIRNPCGSELEVAPSEFQANSPHFKLWGHVEDPVIP
jgi:hypothetical protein